MVAHNPVIDRLVFKLVGRGIILANEVFTMTIGLRYIAM